MPRLLIAVGALGMLALAATGCRAASSSDRTPAGAPATTVSATDTAAPPDLSIFTGFTYPIAGGCLPKSDALMPNAPRTYRKGIHEGVDFYGSDNCTTIVKGTPVLAAKDGVVVRADTGYQDLTQAQLDAANRRIATGEASAPDILDLFRGRQVWVDHGNGIVTRYAHTSGVAPGIEVGARVVQGQPVAYVGDSGTPESLSAPGTEDHGHFELRVGDTYLGQGLPPEDVRAIYERLFAPVP